MSRNPNPGDNLNAGAHSVGLPPRPFLYTLDQISTLLDIQLNSLRQFYIFYDGRTSGRVPADMMMARNIAPPNSPPDWRVAERELVRWMRKKGFKYYDRASIRG